MTLVTGRTSPVSSPAACPTNSTPTSISSSANGCLGPGRTASRISSRFRPDKAGAKLVRGVAPQCKLVSLKVLDAKGRGSTSNIMLALKYIREELNDDPKLLRVHGVNLSLGYEFDAEMFACGQSPLCVEVDRLVKSGVVVVVAAGNTGYGPIGTSERYTKVGISNTINDPGNAALAITVGSTHRDSPHTYGVSFFSSKGPDGRRPPEARPGGAGRAHNFGRHRRPVESSGSAEPTRHEYGLH